MTPQPIMRDPALVAVEMITLLAAGTGIWAELTGGRAAPGQLRRPARAAAAAAATWTIWVLAYLTGMSRTSWFAARPRRPTHRSARPVLREAGVHRGPDNHHGI